MYTSYIGKKFLALYNEREKVDLSAEDFFTQVFFELFFTDESHLMHVGNSPFFQKPKPKDVAKYGSKSLAQFNNLKQNMAEGIPNMSIFVGAAAKDVGSTTSGQVTSIDFNIDKNEMYASWIGEALAIGVNGGLMLIDEPEILWNLYNGWKHYRKYLQQTPHVKDKQIETWNGQWLYHSLSAEFDETNPFNNLHIETTEVEGSIAIPTMQWSKIIFVLSKKYPYKEVVVNAYSLSKANTTLGFINLYLPEVRKIYNLRDKIFINKEDSVLSDKEIEQLSTFYNFKAACQMGTIGLKSLEPDKLREFMPKGSMPFAQGKEFKFTNEESFHNYQLYKIWIIAMLNKTDLLNTASSIATALLEFEKTDERGKKVFANLSQEVRDSKHIKVFIDNLTEVMDHSPCGAETFKQIVEEVLKMPSDNFPLFVTLIRFEYSYQKNKK